MLIYIKMMNKQSEDFLLVYKEKKMGREMLII